MKKLIIISSFIFYSCMTMNVFEGPDTTKKGDTSFGFGISNILLFDESDEPVFIPIPFPHFKGRYGISDNMDIGFRYVGILGFGIDPKIRFLNAGIKGSLSFPFNIAVWPEVPVWYSFEPTLILGRELIYFGSKFSYFNVKFKSETFKDINGIFPSLFLGFTLGKNLKLCPEVIFYLPGIVMSTDGNQASGRPGISYGIGILYMPK